MELEQFMNNKCNNCPLLKTDKDCPGGIFCKTLDPEHPRYNKKYLHRLMVEVGLEAAEYPSILKQAENLAYAVKGIVHSGFAKAMEAEHKKRISLCEECEFFVSKERRCEACGCFVEEKTKWNDSECPKGKWDKLLYQNPVDDIVNSDFKPCNCNGGSQ